jgi:signal transduction histidine kinase
MPRQLTNPHDGQNLPSAPSEHGPGRPAVDAARSAGPRHGRTGPRQASLGDPALGGHVVGWLRAVAASRPAAWVAGGVLAAAALGQAWYEDLPLGGPLAVAVVLATLPLAWSRSRPVVAAYLMAFGAACYAVLDSLELQRIEVGLAQAAPGAPPGGGPLPALLAPVAGGVIGLYLLVRHDRLRVRWVVVVAITVLLGNVLGSREDLAGLAVFAAALAIVAIDAAQTRGELLRERAVALERSVADQRRGAVVAERARIARELHDLVAHSVSVIAVQAELLPPTIPGLPDQARAGFEQIARSARSAMTELRQMLDLLRQGQTAAELAPLPTLAQLDELADAHRAAGGSVELRTHGQPRQLPAVVELSAYRVVQEALTNTRKHTPGAHAQVDVSYAPDQLTVRIADDGPATRATRSDPPGGTVGHGLVGMRERVSMLGGRLRTGPRPSGGFEVTAALPLPVTPRPSVQPQEPEKPGDAPARDG